MLARPAVTFAVLVTVLGVATAGVLPVATGAVDGRVVADHASAKSVPATAPRPAPADATTNRIAALDQPDPSTIITINLTASGDARWTVASRFELANETDERTFRQFARGVENGSIDAGYSVDTFRAFADRGEAVTDRDDRMAIETANWSHRVENDTGVLALSFTWTNFADTDGNRVELGDVFGDENDTWFPALTADQRLVINAPPEYGVEESAFPFSDGSIGVDGPAEVDPGMFPVVYVPIETNPTTTTTTTTTTTPPPDDPSDDESFPLAILGGAIVVAAAILIAAYLITERRPREASANGGVTGDPSADPGGTGTATDDADASAGDAAGVAAGDGPPPNQSAADGNVEAGDGEGDEGGDGAEGDDEESDVGTIDEELLSDEERVERLLRENSGRMKQANIVTETGWSNAKVSQLLSSMADEDRVEKLRIGRENLITLPEEDVGEID